MKVSPYRLKLKKVSRKQQYLLQAISSFLPSTGQEGNLRRALLETIAAHVGRGARYYLEAIVQETYEDFLERLPDAPLVVVFGTAASGEKLLCEIDLSLAIMCVERMLGGQTETMPAPRFLSDIEQGVLQYLLVQILAHIQDSCGQDAALHFRLERIAQSAETIEKLSDSATETAVLAYRVMLGRYAGFVRLVLPEPFVEQALVRATGKDEIRAREDASRTREFLRYAYVRVPIWAEAGRTTLLPEDLKQLEEGDVVLFEQGDLRLSGGTSGEEERDLGQPAARGQGRIVKGNVVLRVGNGIQSGLDAKAALLGRRARLHILGIHKGA